MLPKTRMQQQPSTGGVPQKATHTGRARAQAPRNAMEFGRGRSCRTWSNRTPTVDSAVALAHTDNTQVYEALQQRDRLMNEYFRMADTYFRALEGGQLYPSLKSWHWYAWAVAAALVGVTFWVQVGAHSSAEAISSSWVAVGMAPFLLASFAIRKYRERAILESQKREDGSSYADIDECRAALLRRVCRVEPTSFAAVAAECSNLLGLQRDHRLSTGTFAERYIPRIYDPESKGRIVALILSSLALFVALFNHSTPDSAPSIVDVLADPGVHTLLSIFLTASVFLFIAWLALQAVVGMSVGAVALWWAKLTGMTAGRMLVMRYLLRDLVLLHDPVHAENDKTLSRSFGDGVNRRRWNARPAPAIHLPRNRLRSNTRFRPAVPDPRNDA